MSLPINIPSRIIPGSKTAVTADWANDIREAIVRLARRKSRGNAGGSGNSSYPFKISVATVSTELRLYVSAGRATAMVWPSGSAYPVFSEILCVYSSGGSLKDDPFDPYSGTLGYDVLTAPTTYGVWLNISLETGGGTNLPAGIGEYGGVLSVQGSVGGANIAVSSTYPDPDDGPAYSASVTGSHVAMIYLGKVVVDSDSVATIKQYRKSDVIIPIATLPTALISTDDNNSLMVGTDGSLFVPPIVSLNPLNSISVDATDLGAFYEEP